MFTLRERPYRESPVGARGKVKPLIRGLSSAAQIGRLVASVAPSPNPQDEAAKGDRATLALLTRSVQIVSDRNVELVPFPLPPPLAAAMRPTAA
jgi:hypothetical protein